MFNQYIYGWASKTQFRLRNGPKRLSSSNFSPPRVAAWRDIRSNLPIWTELFDKRYHINTSYKPCPKLCKVVLLPQTMAPLFWLVYILDHHQMSLYWVSTILNSTYTRHNQKIHTRAFVLRGKAKLVWWVSGGVCKTGLKS